MSIFPHWCDRQDCEHNKHSGYCSFFVGDMYFLDCIRNATMYKPMKKDTEDN